MSEWEGGIGSGNIKWYKSYYELSFNDNTKYNFYVKDFKSKKETLEEVKKENYLISKRKGKLANRYRNKGTYYEVQLNGCFLGKIDLEDLYLLEKNHWIAKLPNKKNKRLYMLSNNKSNPQLFHNLVLPEKNEIIHINRDGLDNRRCNLSNKRIRIRRLEDFYEKEKEEEKETIIELI